MYIKLLILFTAMSFIIFGFNCLFSAKMHTEFKRYGLEKFRTSTGLLQITGSLGLIAGLKYPSILLLATAGLAILMLMGVITRVIIKDKPIQLLPAIFYLCICSYLFVQGYIAIV